MICFLAFFLFSGVYGSLVSTDAGCNGAGRVGICAIMLCGRPNVIGNVREWIIMGLGKYVYVRCFTNNGTGG